MRDRRAVLAERGNDVIDERRNRGLELAVAAGETDFHQRTLLRQRPIYHTGAAHVPKRCGNERDTHSRRNETHNRRHLNRFLLDSRGEAGVATKTHDEIVQPDACLARKKDEGLAGECCKRHTAWPSPPRGQRSHQRLAQQRPVSGIHVPVVAVAHAGRLIEEDDDVAGAATDSGRGRTLLEERPRECGDDQRDGCRPEQEEEPVSDAPAAIASASRNRRRASASNAVPAADKRTPRLVRANNGVPSSVSNALICRDSGGCDMWSRAAARPKWRVSATATK